MVCVVVKLYIRAFLEIFLELLVEVLLPWDVVCEEEHEGVIRNISKVNHLLFFFFKVMGKHGFEIK